MVIIMDCSSGSNTSAGDGNDKLNEYYKNETSLEDLLLRERGPKHLPLNVVIPITVVYVAIFATGVVGNIAVCVVIVRNTSLHTATNYYLFSLALSDLTLLLLGLPNDLSVYWQQYPWIFGENVCKLRALVSEMTSYTSVLTIVAFSMERYLAICHPLHSYAMSGLGRALRIIAILWIISFVGAMPFALFTTVHYVDYPPGSGKLVVESAFCAMFEDNLPSNFPIYELSFFFFFFVPLLVIVILYLLIALRLRARSNHSLGKRMEGVIHGESKHTKNRKSIIRMLAAVVITFFLCWAPFHAQRLLYLYARETPYYTEINEWMYYIAGCFYYFSSTINPILYNLMSVKYRVAFRQTLCGYVPYHRNRYQDLHSSIRHTIMCNKNADNSHWERASALKQIPNKLKKIDKNVVVAAVSGASSNHDSRHVFTDWSKIVFGVPTTLTLSEDISYNEINDTSNLYEKLDASSQTETCI